MRAFKKLLKTKIEKNLIEKITSGEFKNPKLNLSGQNLKNSDIGPLVDCLSHVTQIKELDLSNNLINEIEFMANLKVNCVNLSKNPIEKFTKKSSNSYITHLILNETCLKEFDFTIFQNLQSLELRGNKLLNLNNVIFNKSLSHLDISECIFNNLNFISELKNLTTLIANNNNLCDLNFIRSNYSLKNVLVINNKIQQLDALAINQTIEFLNVDYNQVESLLPLSFNKKLEAISIRDNHIKDFKPLIFNYCLKQVLFPNQNDTILKTIMDRNNQCAELSDKSEKDAIISNYNKRFPEITPMSLRALTFFSKPIQENNWRYIQSQIDQQYLTIPLY